MQPHIHPTYFDFEDGCSMFLRNVSIQLQDYTVPQPSNHSVNLKTYTTLLADNFTSLEGVCLNICAFYFPRSEGGWTQLHVGG
jgi:hypothetical protein